MEPGPSIGLFSLKLSAPPRRPSGEGPRPRPLISSFTGPRQHKGLTVEGRATPLRTCQQKVRQQKVRQQKVPRTLPTRVSGGPEGWMGRQEADVRRRVAAAAAGQPVPIRWEPTGVLVWESGSGTSDWQQTELRLSTRRGPFLSAAALLVLRRVQAEV
jgi:hypothetical protein